MYVSIMKRCLFKLFSAVNLMADSFQFKLFFKITSNVVSG